LSVQVCVRVWHPWLSVNALTTCIPTFSVNGHVVKLALQRSAERGREESRGKSLQTRNVGGVLRPVCLQRFARSKRQAAESLPVGLDPLRKPPFASNTSVTSPILCVSGSLLFLSAPKPAFDCLPPADPSCALQRARDTSALRRRGHNLCVSISAGCILPLVRLPPPFTMVRTGLERQWRRFIWPRKSPISITAGYRSDRRSCPVQWMERRRSWAG
jgi:hypothetical protein